MELDNSKPRVQHHVHWHNQACWHSRIAKLGTVLDLHEIMNTMKIRVKWRCAKTWSVMQHAETFRTSPMYVLQSYNTIFLIPLLKILFCNLWNWWQGLEAQMKPKSSNSSHCSELPRVSMRWKHHSHLELHTSTHPPPRNKNSPEAAIQMSPLLPLTHRIPR